MADINTRKRGNKWEYYFEIAKKRIEEVNSKK